MKMKTILPLSVITAMLCMYGCSCGSTDTTYLGDYVNDFNTQGPNRTEAVSFTIGSVAFLTTGWNNQTLTPNGLGNDLNTTWGYDTAVVSWNQYADFPSTVVRYSAVGFAIGSNGYVGTGFDQTNLYRDFYQFNPGSNTWTKKADFPGTPRYDAVAFAIGNYGYVGTGYDNSYTNDFYRYDPISNSWIGSSSTGARMPNLTGTKRSSATAWVLNGNGYVCAGANSGSFVDDFWQFTPSATQTSGAVGTWKQMRRISNATDSSFDDLYATPNITRKNAIAMVISNKVYLMSGDNGSPLPSNWQWSGPLTDQWVIQQPMGSISGGQEAPVVTGAVSMQIGNHGYIATGNSGSTYYSQFWEFLPGIQENPNN